ncbi:MAG: 7-carboxy-7-deazaguanine synthase QueE, partial [Bacteroidales bacterium]|nr:7-carboxy-7-deazaguanine synthase QueE [Bacteroidales bacterium]
GCSWCDSKASWNIEHNKLIDINEIVEKVNKLPVKAVVVTGGEPCKYNLEPLCNLLKFNNIETYIETSGAYKLTGKWNWICLSPKRNSPPLKELLSIANELKVIIFDELDFKWAEENKKKVNKSCKLFLQPEWSRYEKNIFKIVDYVKINPEWNISLQIHKFMHIP